MNHTNRVGHLLTPELLDALDKLYPARGPDPRDSDREIWMKAGERRVIEVLRAKYQEATEEPQGIL